MQRKLAHIRLDSGSATPAYRQIVDQMRALLVEKILLPGETLPPVRRLALELGVHFNTVAEAYRTLAQEGFLDISHGRGATILTRTTIPARAEDEKLTVLALRQRLRELVAELRSRGLTSVQIARELRGMIDILEN